MKYQACVTALNLTPDCEWAMENPWVTKGGTLSRLKSSLPLVAFKSVGLEHSCQFSDMSTPEIQIRNWFLTL